MRIPLLQSTRVLVATAAMALAGGDARMAVMKPDGESYD
jgi:hypothetical protein